MAKHKFLLQSCDGHKNILDLPVEIFREIFQDVFQEIVREVFQEIFQKVG